MVNAYAALEAAVLALHLLWIAWIMLGWLFTRGRRALTAIHLASLFWGVAVELGPWPCPLTMAEQWLASRSGRTPYQQGFLVHYLDKLIYPDLPEAIIGWTGAGVCLAIAGIYARRFSRERLKCHTAN